MGPNALTSTSWTRRRAVVLIVLALAFALEGAGAGRAVAQDTPLLVVSRSRLLNDTAHARALLKAEIALTAELQRRIDEIKESLAAEEQELARLRPTLEREIFDARVAEFDRLVRSQRRDSQRYAANLQNAFRAERLKLVEALGPLLEDVRAGHGASVILDSDKTLTVDPALDITDEVIARFNASVPPPVIPDLDVLTPAPDPAPAPEPEPEPGPAPESEPPPE